MEERVSETDLQFMCMLVDALSEKHGDWFVEIIERAEGTKKPPDVKAGDWAREMTYRTVAEHRERKAQAERENEERKEAERVYLALEAMQVWYDRSTELKHRCETWTARAKASAERGREADACAGRRAVRARKILCLVEREFAWNLKRLREVSGEVWKSYEGTDRKKLGAHIEQMTAEAERLQGYAEAMRTLNMRAAALDDRWKAWAAVGARRTWKDGAHHRKRAARARKNECLTGKELSWTERRLAEMSEAALQKHEAWAERMAREYPEEV